MTDHIIRSLLGRRVHSDDVCALALVRRVAALLDRDPTLPKEGDMLPRGWHAALFTPFARQSELGNDGLPQETALVPNPDPASWPRKVFGGRRTQFHGDVHIGSHVRRESEVVSAEIKHARHGRILIVTVRSHIFEEGTDHAVIIEEQDHIFRGAHQTVPMSTAPRQDIAPLVASIRQPIVIDAVMLFRYSAITFNAHRIHFDFPYTTQTEGYPGLLINGALPALLLLEMVRDKLAAPPALMTGRNMRPLYCGEKMHLCATQQPDGWTLWAENDTGQTALIVHLK